MSGFAKAFFVVLIASVSNSLWSQGDTYHIFSLQDTHYLLPHLQILPVGQDTLSLEDILKPEWQSRFIPYSNFLDQQYPERDQEKMIRLPGDKVYWARVNLVNHLDSKSRLENWLFFPGKSEHTTVYLLDGEGRVRETKLAGFQVPARQKDFSFGNQYPDRVRLEFHHYDSATIIFKSKPIHRRPVVLDATLTRNDFYESWKEVSIIQQSWFFIGFLLTFFFLSFLLFIVARDPVFLFHALFQLGVFFYLLEFLNVLPDLPILRDHPIFIQSVLYMALCLMDVSYLLFIRTFLKLWEKYPSWDLLLRALIVVRVLVMILTTIIFYANKNMPLADDITAWYIMAEYLVMMVFLFLIKESGPQRLFLIGGTLLLSVGIVSNALSVVAGLGIQMSYTQFGGFGEVLLFTLGLGYRMKSLIREQRKVMVLKETDEFKTRFYTNITHEFRTPLTVIQGFAEQLSKELDDPQHLNRLRLIQQNGDRLVRLLNRILSLSKLQSGKMDLNLRQGNIVEFIRYLLFSFQSFAWSKGIHTSFLTDLEKLDMDFDPEKLQDVITNLISNAIKFNHSDGRITVLLKVMPSGAHKGKLMIQVKDTGLGMTKEEMEHLFERFYQSSPVRKKGQGSGLGLSITRELVWLMKGTIEVSSKSGEGSTFSVYLPITNQAPALTEKEIAPIEIDLEGEPERKEAETKPIDEEKPLALIVEDNHDVISYLQQLLEKDFNVIVAYDGAEGIEKAILLVPDVILSDVIMPNKDGLELCQTLKNDERTSHIPIILATAKATVEDRLAGLQRGADAYLAKPFNQNELFLYLQNFVMQRKKLQERYASPQKKTLPAPPPGEESFEIEDAFVSKLRRIVESHLGEEGYSATQMAREIRMSRSQLHRKLTALTGQSATSFINAIRLQKARELLLQSDLTVSEIAFTVGLEPNYFSRLFKEEVGQTPSEFRNGVGAGG